MIDYVTKLGDQDFKTPTSAPEAQDKLTRSLQTPTSTPCPSVEPASSGSYLSSATDFQPGLEIKTESKALDIKTLVEVLFTQRRAAASLVQRWYRRRLVAVRYKVAALANEILKVRAAAATLMQSQAKGWLIRKDTRFIRQKALTFALIGSNPVFVSSCTIPPWEKALQLSYSKYLGLYYLELDGSQITPGIHSYKILIGGNPVTQGFLRAAEGSEVELLRTSLRNSSVVQTLESLDLGLSHSCESILHQSMSRSCDFNPIQLTFTFGEPASDDLKLIARSYMAARPDYARQELTSLNSSDAVFIDEATQSFGIADGVGSWKSVGLDPGALANELMKSVKNELTGAYETFSSMTPSEVGESLKTALSRAYNTVEAYGSTTALLGICIKSTLVTANLGDSTVIVLRPTGFGKVRVVFRSKEMQHAFNCPFQLSSLPAPKTYRELVRKGYGMLVKYLQEAKNIVKDNPTTAAIYTVPLHSNDIVIAGSDGLFDNLQEISIVEQAEAGLKNYQQSHEQFCSQLAEKLTRSAAAQSFKKNYMSPFAQAAKKAKKSYVGGKPDDVSVCVGVLTN